MSDVMGDPTFSINHQALAFLQILASMEPDFAYKNESVGHDCTFNTYPWYNCRERGIVVSMQHRQYRGPWLHIAFFEHRNSDSFCAVKWEDMGAWDNPTLADVPEEDYPDKYTLAKSVGYLELAKMREWAYARFEEFWNEEALEIEERINAREEAKKAKEEAAHVDSV